MATKTQTTTSRTKAKTDYDRLIDQTELVRDGLAHRLKAHTDTLREQLKDHPQKDAVLETIKAYSGTLAEHAAAAAKLQRYHANRAKEA